MEKSFLRTLLSRELNGLTVRKMPYNNSVTSMSEIGALEIEQTVEETPPLAISFSRIQDNRNANVLALADEAGYVSLLSTPITPVSSKKTNGDRIDILKLSEWSAHQNAIFDLCWIKDDRSLLTSSGDQTIKVWDTQVKKCTAVLTGHTGSVKSLSPHPKSSDILLSGSRDGSFALWDLRCNNTSSSHCGEQIIGTTSMVQKAHQSPYSKRSRRGKGSSMSITSVLYLKDEISVATACAVDSVVKFWDTRHLKTHINEASPYTSYSNERRLHGISSLSQDASGMLLTAACTDSKIYLYNILALGNGPTRCFSGGRIDSFYVKSAISPNAEHIVSGSSDGNVCVWDVSSSDKCAIVNGGHSGEVTSVDWCPYDSGKVASCSDDCTVKIWNTETHWSCGKRRRGNCEDMAASPRSGHSPPMVALTTPNSKGSTIVDPERSPSSVLNPPSSLKRKTIPDYFLQ